MEIEAHQGKSLIWNLLIIKEKILVLIIHKQAEGHLNS